MIKAVSIPLQIKSGPMWSVYSCVPISPHPFSDSKNFSNSALGMKKRHYKTRVRLMCVLRTHIKFSVFGNIFSRIEKVMTAFSILKKIFLKTENLMCALRAHISKIHKTNTNKEHKVDNCLNVAISTNQSPI